MKSKVAVIPCRDYDNDEVYQAVSKGIDLLGGLGAFLKPEEKLLLKPNLLNRAAAEKAVTTHPAVFEAVIRVLKEKGFNQLTYGDSPGHPGGVEKTADICGIKAAADKYQVRLAEFSKSRTQSFTRGSVSRKYEICEGVLDADAIINICKMKTHQLERITGGVKNLFGCVCGLNKGAAHARYPDADSFAQMLVDLNLMLKPRLHVMDAIVAMEGNGPASGNPINMNLVLLSSDPVALDATFCRLVDLDPKTVPTIFYGEIFGLGQWEADKIEIVGVDSLKDYINPKFDVSREKVFAGKWAFLDKLKVIGKKPVIEKSRCISCGACIRACPLDEKAIAFNMRAGKEPIPEYNYKTCIRCYCCQEMCQEKAINVKRKLDLFHRG